LDEELKHFGILGMHWGQHKAEDSSSGKSGSLTAYKRFQRDAARLEKSGKGNDQAAVNKLAAQYDRNRATENKPYSGKGKVTKAQIAKWKEDAKPNNLSLAQKVGVGAAIFAGLCTPPP
jgi:hypothetical protein